MNARSLSTRALNLMEDLGEVMDDSAYAQLLEPIIRHLEQAQRTMQQGTAQAGQQAAAGVSMKKEAKTKTKTAGDGLPAFMRVPPGYQGEL